MATKRQKAIARRNIFVSVVACVLVAATVGVCFAAGAIFDALKNNGKNTDKSSKKASSSAVSKNDKADKNDKTSNKNEVPELIKGFSSTPHKAFEPASP